MFQWKRQGYLDCSSFVVGDVLIDNNDIMVLYLGRTDNGAFVFHKICSVDVTKRGDYFTLLRESAQLIGINAMIDSLTKEPADRLSVHFVSSTDKGNFVYKFTHLDREKCEAWYAKSLFYNSKLPALSNNVFVKPCSENVNEYLGRLFKNMVGVFHIYLGRSAEHKNVWCQIISTSNYRISPIGELERSIRKNSIVFSNSFAFSLVEDDSSYETFVDLSRLTIATKQHLIGFVGIVTAL